MKTVTVQIGNSDDRLTQAQWSYVLREVEIYASAFRTHFFGASLANSSWQNCCWVFNCPEDEIPKVREWLVECASRHGQDSIALTVGETEFVGPAAKPPGNPG